MTIAQIADKNANCGGANADTGKAGCQITFGTPLHAIGMRKGFIIPANTVFDKVYIDTQIQLGNFIPLIDADAFEELSSEDSMTTNTRGVERLSVYGLPKYKLTFQEGHEFYKQIARLTSFKSLDFIFGDDEGNWRVVVTANGDFKGFSCGQVLAMITKTKVQGGDPESKSITVQMLDRMEWDRDYAILGRSTLTFSPSDLDGINGVIFEVSPMVAADTTIKVKLVLAADRSTPVQGWKEENFLVTSDGVAVVPTTVVEGAPGEYTFTITAQTAGKKVVISSNDATVKTQAVLLEGILYRGISDVVTVGA
jgi:hypothetical protein